MILKRVFQKSSAINKLYEQQFLNKSCEPKKKVIFTHWLHVLHIGADDLIFYENMLMQGDQTQMKPNWHGDV